jgi:glucan phosphoethanolaminetransferase (alkaline phosphatase superfamily)
MNKPILIEPGTKYFLSETLKNCNKSRTYYNNILLNISLLSLFILVISLYLGYKYNTKKNKSSEDKTKKQMKIENYILGKLGNVFYEHQKKNEQMLTNLPKFESDYELLHEKFYNI